MKEEERKKHNNFYIDKFNSWMHRSCDSSLYIC